MHFVIMGAGRVGSSLASQLDQMGHSVAVIDRDSDAFRRLPANFNGRRVTGLGFDRDSLRQAGIEEAYAFAAVSNGDNSNIIAARVVRETFGVERVVARIYDPQRAVLYQRLGIPTVGTVKYTTSEMLQRMIPSESDVIFNDAPSDMQIVHEEVNEEWTGIRITEFEREFGTKVAFLRRLSEGVIPDELTVFQEGDEVFFAVHESARVAAVRGLQRTPQKED
ncbi:potassium transporter TrkA [Boudabousia tangfeifanii]|uniref:Potassium transporter TrkA n=1 Tax=Boudabousia tangfeifanii TaxID=1912795 RepID=A0A1D9MKH0_9ACTO|nr:TrkA family potassium uptake protein [Boudabousia tangfeifanii]AOZ72673.1 potassium transporter TrkA [Boudabousia tangfeifanii]